jgi:uncharacterized GH25 family protein
MGLAAAPAGAHEYWIEPEGFRLDGPGNITARIRIGENFKGNEQPYLSSRFVKALIAQAGTTSPVTGHEGDMPALKTKAIGAGVNVLAVSTNPHFLTYDSAEKFQTFLANQGLDGVLAAHRKRGLPDQGFAEAYSRYAKALVQVRGAGGGDMAGDTVTGLKLELVALRNPYRLKPQTRSHLPVKLLWQGQPLAGAQIKLFRFKQTLTITRLRTDASGHAKVPLGPGGRFLLSAVRMTPWTRNKKAVWHSHWASLTFRVDVDP